MTSRRHQIGIISRLEPVEAPPSLWFTRARWFAFGVVVTLVVLYLAFGVITR